MIGQRALRPCFPGLALLGLAAAAGCNARSVTKAAECQTDPQCGDGMACVGGACISRTTAPASWAIEVEPRSDSRAARTDFESIPAPPSGGPLLLTAEAEINVGGTLTSPTNGPALTSAHVVASVPSVIQGRPALEFAADLAVPGEVSTGAGQPLFELVVPEGVLGRQATVQVVPVAPQDASFPPLSFTTQLGAALAFSVPIDNYMVTGRYFDALRQPREGFQARAFRNGQLVSTADVTNNAGAFSLSIPVATVDGDPNTPFSVELKPLDPAASDPRFSTPPFKLSGSVDLGSLYQAAFTQPNVFRLTVRGGTDGGPPVAGAVVRARTVLALDPMAGTTDFLRDARTDALGNADISLLPGTATEARAYTIAVIPPPESTFGLLCLSDLPLLAGGTAAAPANLQPIVIPRRANVTGAVLDVGGQPVRGVVVAATRTAAADGTVCAETIGSPPANATTDESGHFTLPLDPGTYQIDYDPPGSSAVPRLTETGVLVAGDLQHDTRMPPGGLVEGDVRGPTGAVLPSAAVRFYDHTPAVTLQGQGRTDANGHFRIVIPLGAQ